MVEAGYPVPQRTVPTDHMPVLGGSILVPEVPVTRLRPHTVRLPSGQQVGLAVGGSGVPLVVIHGFSFTGMLYVQSLSRLASMGFEVVAVDLAGHGASHGLTKRGHELDEYRAFLDSVLDALGIRRSVLVGHSLGGRLVAEVAANEPERAIAVLLIDAAVGRAWDELATFARYSPPVLGMIGATLTSDTLGTLFLSGDQGLKLQGLALPQAVANLFAPWRLVAPALSVLQAPPSIAALDRLGAAGVPTFVLHGDRDPVVPLAAARDAARRAGAELVVVHRGSHSWLLEDPATLRAIVAELQEGALGAACRAEAESDFFAPDALIRQLADDGGAEEETRPRQPPAYRWSRPPAI